jgi:hypothetical protein
MTAPFECAAAGAGEIPRLVGLTPLLFKGLATKPTL